MINAKTKVLLSLSFVLFLFITVTAQDINAEKGVKYRRSSLHTILLESGNFPQKDVVINAYVKMPFPDNYNNHALDLKTLNPDPYKLTAEEKLALNGENESQFKSMLKQAGSELTGGIIDSLAKDMPGILAKAIKEQKIANQLVAKWFSRKPNGGFDMKLIGDRGLYDASEMEAFVAKGTARGLSSLEDAGEELIKNTFVVFNRMNFVSNEPIAALIREGAKAVAAKNLSGIALDLAYKAADKIYEKTKEGYSVWATSYLFKLNWNDSISTIFYTDYYFDGSKDDAARKAKFDNSDLFTMEFVGSEKSSSLVTFSLKAEKRSEEQIIEKATVRNVEAVFAKLQKEYEVFKPKVPLYTADPITAKIGMKEGLEGGEKFEVLQQKVDPETGRTKYDRVGVITVDKNMVWDNRFAVTETIDAAAAPAAAPAPEQAAEPASEESKGDKKKGKKSDKGGDENGGGKNLDRTTFKGSGKFYPGMLIRQIKG
jgi:hypothetical protein